MKEQFDLELFPMMPDEPVVADAFDEAELITEIAQEDLTIADLKAQRDAFEKAYEAANLEIEAQKKNGENMFASYSENVKAFNANIDEASRVIKALGDFHEKRLAAYNAIIDNARVLMTGFELPEKGE